MTNGTTADADQVMQNFNDLLNGITDGTKDLSISALTAAGTATFNGAVTLGNATADDITVTGSLASSIPVKTNSTYGIGSATLGLSGIYYGGTSTFTARVVAATLAASRTYTMPDAGGAAEFVMNAGASTIAGLKTFNDGIKVDDDANQDTLDYYRTENVSMTFTFNGTGSPGNQTADSQITRVGNVVTIVFAAYQATTGTNTTNMTSGVGAIPDWARPAATIATNYRARNNGVADTANVSYLTITAAGTVTLQRDYAGGNWTAGASGGVQTRFAVQYLFNI